MRPDDAAIVGIGALFPRATGPAEFWRSIEGGLDAIADVPPERWDPDVYYTSSNQEHGADRFYCRRGGFIDDLASFDPIRFGVMPNVVDATEPDQLLALRVTAEAIADAGGEDRLPDDRSRIGVVFGRGGYMGVATARLDQRVRTAHQLAATLRDVAPELGEERIAAIRAAFQESLGTDRPEAAIGLVPSFTAARIANRLDFGGPAYTVDAACATSLLAVEQAAAELAAGRCDLMVAGAVHHTHIATLWSVFTQLRALSPSQRIRPFDRRADGTLISEGTGVVLLKRLADAERDGDRIYAVIRGTGTASDGRASSLMSPLVDGQVRALERAWRAAGLDPTEPGALGLLEAHGTGTPVGDDAELATLARVFGPPGGDAAAVGLGTVKSNIGHAMQASGIAGLIKAALAVHHRVLPPTLHVDDPHRGFAATRMRPLLAAEPWDTATPRRAGVNAFGFGGINAHAVLEEPPGTFTPAIRITEPPRVLLIAGKTPAEVGARLARTDRPGAPSDAGGAGTPGGSGGAAGLGHAGGTGGSGGTGGKAGTGGVGDGPCRLAILDPTPRRLELAAKVVARGKAWRGRSDVWFTPEPLGGRTAFLFPGLALEGTGELLGQAVDDIGSGRALTAALERIGIRPDLLAGHSLGEWTAMVVAGMYPREAIDAFLDSLRPGTLDVPDLVYAAVGCGAEQAAAHTSVHAAVSHDNCPHQSVICGPAPDIAGALRSLAAEGVLGQELPFRSGFHTPMWEPYLDQVRATFARLPLRPPAVPVWSATTAEPYPAAEEDVRALVIRHLLEPVRFRALTERLHAEGVRSFVQIGPGGLPGFIDDTLRGREHLTVGADDASGLPRVAAALWTEGAAPRWETMNVRVPQREVRLALGSPIISLNGRTPQTHERPVRRDHPVLASLDAALDDMSAAVRTVVDAWQEPPERRAQRTARGTKPSTERGTERSTERGTERRTELRRRREFSLATMPYVIDHCVYLQPDDWPDDSDRFPVVPMTTLLDVMAETALQLVPGKVVAGFAGVRAMRWLPVAPATTADIVATRRSPDTVRVIVTGFASADVILCDSHPVPPPPRHDALAGAEPPPVSAAGLYDDRWMFHGPGFAGVRDVREISEEGIGGELEALPAPGALLDAAGQLYGHWMQVRLPTDRLVFPVSIDRVRLYGPHPRPGVRLTHTARIRSVKADIVRGDIELSSPDGRLWARIEGWAYRRFAADERVWPMKFTPETHAIGEAQPDGTTVVKRRWSDAASRELVMRRYLCAAERAEYEALTPRAQQAWLLGRMAVKDAVRHARWARGDGPIFPAEVRVTDASGDAGHAGDAGHLTVAGARVRLERSDDDIAVARCDPDGLEAP